MVSAFDTESPDLHSVAGWVGGDQVLHLAVPNCPTEYRSARDAFEKEFILATLRLNGGTISRAALAMKVSRRHLHARIIALCIDIKSVRRRLPVPPDLPGAGNDDDILPVAVAGNVS